VPDEDDGPPDLLADVPCGPPLVWSALTGTSEPVPNRKIEPKVITAIARFIFFMFSSGV